MDTAVTDINLWEWDARLPPNWRFLDAQRLVADEMPTWSSDHPAVLECAAYLRACTNGECDLRWSALEAAHGIAEQDDPVRWEIRARILARQSDAEIATKCGVSPDVIGCFARVFFAVRSRLGASMWISNHVVGFGLWRGFYDDEVEPLWAAYAYHGGPYVIDAFVAAFRSVWRPGEKPALSAYLRQDAAIDPQIQAHVAARVLPPFGPAAAVFDACHRRLIEADESPMRCRRELLKTQVRDYTIACGRCHLAGEPLPKQPWNRRRKPAKKRDQTPAAKTASAHDQDRQTVVEPQPTASMRAQTYGDFPLSELNASEVLR